MAEVRDVTDVDGVVADMEAQIVYKLQHDYRTMTSTDQGAPEMRVVRCRVPVRLDDGRIEELIYSFHCSDEVAGWIPEHLGTTKLLGDTVRKSITKALQSPPEPVNTEVPNG